MCWPLEICCKNNEILCLYLFTLKGTKNGTRGTSVSYCYAQIHSFVLTRISWHYVHSGFIFINILASVFNITPARSAQLPALILPLLLGGREELAHLSPLPFIMWSVMMKAVSQLSKYHHVQWACSLYRNVSDSGLHFSSDLYLSPLRWTHHGSFLFFTFSLRNPQLQLVRTCLWICSSSLVRVSSKRDGFLLRSSNTGNTAFFILLLWDVLICMDVKQKTQISGLKCRTDRI